MTARLIKRGEDAAMARHAKIAMDAWRTERVTPRTLLESYHVLRIGPKEIAQYRDGILWVMPLRTRWHIPGGALAALLVVAGVPPAASSRLAIANTPIAARPRIFGCAPRSGFITLVLIVELYWVLTASHGLTGQQVKQTLEVLLCTQQIIVDRADQVLRALRVFDGVKADFADCLTERTAVSAGCEQIMTFDNGAAKHVGMTLIR